MNVKFQFCFLAVLLISAGAKAQMPAEQVDKDSGASRNWSFSFTADGYLVPDDSSYGSIAFSADHKLLHLETRYNYEDLQTGSAWVGCNFEAGEKLKLEATPMVGSIFGNTTGVAPGYEVSLTYKRLDVSTEGEFVFDTRDSSGNFFYSWAELGFSPKDWLRIGLAAQHTKVYHTGLDTQRGFFAGVSHRKVDFATYVFNLGWTDPTVVLQVGVSF